MSGFDVVVDSGRERDGGEGDLGERDWRDVGGVRGDKEEGVDRRFFEVLDREGGDVVVGELGERGRREEGRRRVDDVRKGVRV